MSPVIRTILTVVVIIVTIFFMVWANTYYRQYKYFTQAEQFKTQNKPLDAIARYESTIRMYTPGSSMVRKSIENIWQYGEQFQNKNDNEHALIAFRSLCTSLYAIRSFYAPYRDWRTKAEQRITELLAVEADLTVRKQTGHDTLTPAQP